jgi:hypothetical protein
VTRLVFLDTETVTLEPGPDVIWEIGAIVRGPGMADLDLLWQVRPNMAKAEPKALEISRFHERFLLPDDVDAAAIVDGVVVPLESTSARGPELAARLVSALTGRHVVGCVPNFDTERVGLLLRALGAGPCWHYHLIDVENLAVGYLLGQVAHVRTAAASALAAHVRDIRDITAPPWDSETLSRALGVEPDAFDRHTALGDCRWARAIHDAVTG